ncbi:hypothetical protein J3L18_08985 [Mucilaginibacter gossypii]|uniref:hypothetical protein n=1 Tax=Mucilaginibacter gossypii TaxID=551996 RepID=UPI000DCD971B|nr:MULTISPECIES: hypothetical protein [Mucilaginibacter]QTE39174.1 hypothetical protein J3L18_08985 [Mucilaginibacter gossypii]RAV51832.1 hypothetical protein DIU36_25225 [Mucilaginibacter rubeus]
MITIKTVSLSPDEKAELEKALRKFSAKRETNFDFISSEVSMGADKIFLGYEGNRNIHFTRPRTFIDRYLPKLIINLPRNTTDLFYRLRLSNMSTAVLALLVIGIAAGIISASIGEGTIQALIYPPGFLFMFALGTLLEYKLSALKVKKAISKYRLLKHRYIEEESL